MGKMIVLTERTEVVKKRAARTNVRGQSVGETAMLGILALALIHREVLAAVYPQP